jgi:probable HAF family extracellular repeat protein
MRNAMQSVRLFGVVLMLSNITAAQESPMRAASVQDRAAHYHHYKLIDLGTFGGPASYLTDPGNGRSVLVLNNQGMVAGRASTSTPDPNAPNCLDVDCYLAHAFRWNDGVLGDLGTLPGGNFSQASGINARGWVAVDGTNGDIDPLTGFPVSRGALWKDGQLIDLGTLDGGLEVDAAYVNNGGQVVGFATVGTSPDPSGFSFLGAPIHPFVWKNGVMRDLGTLGGPDALPAPNCNNQRENLIAGSFVSASSPDPNTGAYPVSAFLWDNGKMTNLGTLGGTELFELMCANNAGQVAGGSTLAGDQIMHAFLWDTGSMHDLGTLGGTFSTASWLNNAGEVVGGATTPGDASFHATLWRNGQIVDLGTLEGDCASFALANNAQGQILGESYSCDGPVQRTFLWDKGEIIDLNSVIPVGSNLQLAWATNINDRGEIVGRGLPLGCHEDEQSRTCGHAFLLVPCDGAGIEGCQGNAVEAAQINSATARTNTATASTNPQRTKEFVDRLRARLAPKSPKHPTNGTPH